MIELAVFFVLLIVNCIMSGKIEYAQTMNAFVSIATMSVIFVKFFLVVVQNKSGITIRKYSSICALYTLMVADGILASVLFTGFVSVNSIASIAIRALIYTSYVSILVVSKINALKDRRPLGKTYMVLEIMSTVILSVLVVIDFLETPQMIARSNVSVKVSLALLAALAACSITVDTSRKYWYHRNILMMRLTKLADTYKMDKAVIPPRREIESDYILQETKYVLEESFCRPYELSRLVKKLHDLMIEKGYTKSVAVDYAGLFAQTLVVNLMKRKYDFSIIPNPILKIFRKYDDFKGNRRR